MVVTSRILLNPEFRTIAFCGTARRHILIRRITGELARKGKRVLLISDEDQKLPVKGSVVLGKQLPILVNQIIKEFAHQRILIAGKQLRNKTVEGFNWQSLELISQALPADYLLIDINAFPQNQAVLPAWMQRGFWDQLVYCVDIDDWKTQNRLSENLQSATGNLFFQDWPALLLFNGIDATARENLAISFSRELHQKGIRHIALGNLSQNIIRPLFLPQNLQ